MNLKWTARIWVLVGGVLLLLFTMPGQAMAQSGGTRGSLDAGDISVLFNIVMVMAVIVFVAVEGMLIYAIVQYRRRSDDERPEQVHGNTKLELSLTFGSGVLIIILFFFTLGFYQQPRTIPDDVEPLTVEVTAGMWYWQFDYVDAGITQVQRGLADTGLRVPAGRPVVLEITSLDVQHSFWVPGLAGKVDAIPGRIQRLWFEVDDPQIFLGQCAEYCGTDHYNMHITVNVMPEEEFEAWVQEEAAVAQAAAAQDIADLVGDAAEGEALYTTMGCLACHSLDGSVMVGPSWQGIGDRVQDIEGYTPEAYIQESILNPCVVLVEGFNCVMPQNYADQLSPQNLADLTAFILEQ